MKFLRRFCSEQVQILLERMDDHWVEEFAIEGSKWEPMLPYGKAFEQFTKIEQRCIRKTAQEQTTKWKKEKAYTGILERTMSPTKTRWEFDDEKHGRIAKAEGVRPSRVMTTAALQQQAQNLLEKEYAKSYAQNAAQNSYSGTLQPHAQYAKEQARFAEADRLREYMHNMQYELSKANSTDELKALMQKQQFLMEHERHIIEHQQFLKQHAPRGYI
jgi:hypothetical protein